MDIQKWMDQAMQAVPGTPDEADLELIYKHTRRELPAEELYVFHANLCDNAIDRDGERFTKASLETLAQLFVGKTGLFDHSGKSGDQVMRIYAAQVQEDPARTTQLGEVYAALCAKVYLLRGGENEPLIRAIDGGIKKEVSISCAVKHVRCSVCGKTFGKEGCSHQKGRVYNGKACHAVLEEPTDAYEFSFVAVPAQPAAGVQKRLEEPGYSDEGNGEGLDELHALAEDGRFYRAQLLHKTLQAGAAALPGVQKELLHSMCCTLPASDMRQLCAALEQQAAKTLPLKGQLFWNAAKQKDDNGEFKMN